MAALPPIDRFLIQVLRGNPQPVALDDTSVGYAASLRRVQFHGMVTMLANRPDVLALLPEGLSQPLCAEAKRQAILTASREQVLRRLVEGLAAAGIVHLLLKGARLAYSLHADPAERPAGDIDLLIQPTDRARTRTELHKMGFSHQRGLRDGLHQEDWTSPPEFGLTHHLDLHRALSNSPAIAHRIFRLDPFARAVSLPALTQVARGLDGILSLTLGVINQTLHTQRGYMLEGERVAGADRLGWVYDNHLLAGSFAESDWRELTGHLQGSGAAPLVLAALEQSADLLGTEVPAWVLEALARDPKESWLARYIGEASLAERLRYDLAALAGPGEMLALLGGHMFPPADHMRQRTPDRAHWPLGVLYALRFFGHGVRR